ncbi:MAG: hypothetical protein F6K17_17015 [Okeania sp. SIO3C4]|nr:hypothetical protein [Okeania sp. SIO3B3]NER04190.1 hypothetical protein [Okeania sp. SIO3C4]
MNTKQKINDTTAEYAITDYEELDLLELEEVASGAAEWIINFTKDENGNNKLEIIDDGNDNQIDFQINGFSLYVWQW